ncbi:major facilitator superfamily domain-containing protein [Aspergillus affinis]|uniref:major facilitator superfamily domain-containing protein n=1 Tax=Aspergillus affinis TaxID=1070780 RepID=UPI0022FF4393|nr:major facilitator superfamily domain-containing protein [Aspergillus affinis]KAI9044652.1 major facilitator superfamily domain-containing protein [Aspergillus affinis]
MNSSSRKWRSSTWFIVTQWPWLCLLVSSGLTRVGHLWADTIVVTDTFLASFIVPIVPYIVEDRLGLNPRYTQSISSWLLAENTAVSVVVRMPLAHYADQSASKRSWLLWALVICLISTIATAFAPSLFVLFIGRFVQAFSSSIMWVVGYTTVADSVRLGHIGMVYSMIYTAVSLGTSSEPMLSGILFQLAGYWSAWACAFAVIAIDIGFRLLMLEKNYDEKTGKSIPSRSQALDLGPQSERAPFIDLEDADLDPHAKPKTSPNFYRCIFSKRNFVCGIYCSFTFGLLMTTFNTTVPLHVREVFNWGGMPSGLMFAALQAPRLVMSPIVGWLKDRVDSRMPTTAGLAILAPLMWLLGVPGNPSFPWANFGTRGPVLYVLTMCAIGIQSTFLNGGGTIEATMAVDELDKQYPGAFGPNAGKSRALTMVSVSYILGACVGPVLAGALNERFGYYVMGCVLAALCAFSSVVLFRGLLSRPKS